MVAGSAAARPRLGQDPLHRAGRPDRRIALGQGLGQVHRVEPGKRRERLVHDRRPDHVVDPVDRPPATVAVDQAGGSLGPEAVGQPLHLAGRELQVRGRLTGVELAGQHMSQDQEALLRLGIQRDRLPRLHGIEGDKVAVALGRTELLTSDT